MAAKNEEKRQVELKKRQEYSKGLVKSTTQPKRMLELTRHNTGQNRQLFRKQNDEGPRCYKCGKFGHLQKQCKTPKTESGGRQQWKPNPTKPNPTRRILTGRNFTPEDFLRKSDRTARNYDGQPFQLDGVMDLDITFDDKTIRTSVYIKMNAHDQLLLSEGECRQLGIVHYHPDIQKWNGGRRKRAEHQKVKTATVPTVRVRLVQTLRLLPQQSTVIKVQIQEGHQMTKPLMLEPDSSLEESAGLQVVDGLLEPGEDGEAHILVANTTGFTQNIEQGLELGSVIEATPISVPDQITQDDTRLSHAHLDVKTIISQESSEARKKKLFELLPQEKSHISPNEQQKLYTLLAEQNEAFSLMEDERGETNLVRFQIDTGDASPKRQPVRRVPFAIRQEIAQQLKKMQDMKVVKPSSSPWASPIVLVKKKDGTLRFCIDYRKLNSVTKTDNFPLLRIDDLLDQLDKSRYFSTLDLASRYWQIQVHPDSQEKTAFIKHQGLYEFQVMPFRLCNAPAVFQKLMQRVLLGLNPEAGPDYVAVYLDDVLVFSRTIDEHLKHLNSVINRSREAGLQLKPSKCHFVRKEVEYLGQSLLQKA